MSQKTLKEMVDKYFSLQNIGIQKPQTIVESNSKGDENYVAPLLRKSQNLSLPDSYQTTLAYLRQFE